VVEEVRPLSGNGIALLGLALRAGTDDVRESPAVVLAGELLRRGVRVIGYDRYALTNFA